MRETRTHIHIKLNIRLYICTLKNLGLGIFSSKNPTRATSLATFLLSNFARSRAGSPSVLSRVRPRASVPAVWRGASSVNSPVNSNALEARASVAREVSGEGKRTKGSRAEGTV